MTECKYEGCNEEVFEDSDYCILHLELPENENSAEFKRINSLKEKKVQEKIGNENFNFKGAKLFEVNFREVSIDKSNLLNPINLNFINSKINGNITFEKSQIRGNILFDNSQIQGDVFFIDSGVVGKISFNYAKVKNINFTKHTSFLNISFNNALIDGNVILEESTLDNITFNEAKKIKKIEIEKVTIAGNISFNSTIILSEVWFKEVHIEQDLYFQKAEIGSYVFLNDINVLGDLSFIGATVGGGIYLREGGHIGGDVTLLGLKKVENIRFEACNIDGNVNCAYAKISGNALLNESTIGNSVNFDGATVKNNISFNNANINKHVKFIKAEIGQDINFNNAKIGGKACFHVININGKLDCKKTEFIRLDAQEEMCRVAKNCAESLGDKEEVDNYFYREMEAKRLQKPVYIKKLEWILQKFFGYGVYPLRIITTFFAIFIIFSLIFWQINGIFLENSIDYINLQIALKLSFLTLIIPAYGLVSQSAANYGFYIIIEAIIGAFMWPLFIATFARKYMR